ncbi:MAG: pyridoxal-phosphate dependent enzyme [Pirellulaceae bacterium]
MTGQRDRLTLEITEQQQAVQASPYDDNDVIAGNGVGGLEIVHELQEQGRGLSHFICPVSGGGLLAGHALGDTRRLSNSENCCCRTEWCHRLRTIPGQRPADAS